MIDAVRGWLLCVTCAAMLAAMAETLMQDGQIKVVGKLVCGLLLIFAVLRPLKENATDLTQNWEYHRLQLEEETLRLQSQTGEQMKQVIEVQMSAYSMDKAAQSGIECEIKVSCRTADGGFLPQSAQVAGVNSGEEMERVAAILTQDLGIKPEYVTCREVSGS